MTPDQICKNGSEHSEQAALFAWCAMAARFGVDIANMPTSYDGRMRDQMPNEFGVVNLRLLFAINNATGRDSVIHGARNKAEGVKKGVIDMMLPVAKIHSVKAMDPLPGQTEPRYLIDQWHGLFLEMKRRDAYRENNQLAGTSADQKKWIGDFMTQGYAVAVVYGYHHARDTILDYLK